jgi:hypothetical protein
MEEASNRPCDERRKRHTDGAIFRVQCTVSGVQSWMTLTTVPGPQVELRRRGIGGDRRILKAGKGAAVDRPVLGG